MKLSVAASDRTHELGQALRRQVAMDRGTVGCNWLRFRRRSSAARRVQSEAEYLIGLSAIAVETQLTRLICHSPKTRRLAGA